MPKAWISCLLVTSLLTGCGKLVPKLDEVLPDKRVEYKKSKTLPDLEVPPDLTTDAIRDRMVIPQGGETATYSGYQERVAERRRQEELERTANEAIKLLENEHILAAEGAPRQLWPQLQAFLVDRGYHLDLNDEELGILETAWVENEEELRRDKFKIFAEAGQEAGTTLLYISHRAEELVARGGEMTWQAASRDVAREQALVEDLQRQLTGAGTAAGAAGSRAPRAEPAASYATEGAETAYAAPDEAEYAARDEGSAAAQASAGRQGGGRAELISAGGGKVYLSVLEDFPAAWQSTGAALERAGITVDQSDKSRGLYFIRLPASAGEAQKRGVLSKLKFWGDDDEHELQLSLTGVGDAKTEVVVLDREGRWETGPISATVLNRLNDAINSLGT